MTIGGFGYAAKIQLIDDGQLEFIPNEYRPDDIQRRVCPSSPAWEHFHQELDSLKVWEWKHEYFNHDICDGTQWKVEIIWGSKKYIAFGSNSYPTKDGKSTENEAESVEWQRFISAVNELFGMKCFSELSNL